MNRLVVWLSMVVFGLASAAAPRASEPGPAALPGNASSAPVQPASPATAPGSAPRIVIDEPIFDFGTAEEGSLVSHVYKVRNTGGGELIIKQVRPG